MAIWALRLGTYVALRVAKGPEDARYADPAARNGAPRSRPRMFGLLIVQAPATAAAQSYLRAAGRADDPHPALRVVDVLGALILAGSIAGEDLADRTDEAVQRPMPANKGKVCDVGPVGLVAPSQLPVRVR